MQTLTPSSEIPGEILDRMRIKTALTPCSRVLPEKLTGPQLFKKFPKFYGTRKFITPFTSARHLSIP
jgi:hypothetical protein